MRKLLLIAVAAFLFTHCSETELVGNNFEDSNQDLELRNDCPPGEFCVDDAAAIYNFGLTQSNCAPQQGCPNLCVTSVNSCKNFGTINDCVSELEIRNWIRSFVFTNSGCGKPNDGFCYPELSVNSEAQQSGVFQLCLKGNTWKCPDDIIGDPTDPVLTFCERLAECLEIKHEVIFNGNVIPNTNTHYFTITNTCDEPILITNSQGSQVLNLGQSMNWSEQSQNSVSVSASLATTLSEVCDLGPFGPIG